MQDAENDHSLHDTLNIFHCVLLDVCPQIDMPYFFVFKSFITSRGRKTTRCSG